MLSQTICLILTLSELIEAYKEEYGIEENEILNDKCSGLFNSAICLGAMMGPVIGGYLTDLFGYRITNDVMAISVGIYSVVYFVFNMNLKDFRKESKIKENIIN